MSLAYASGSDNTLSAILARFALFPLRFLLQFLDTLLELFGAVAQRLDYGLRFDKLLLQFIVLLHHLELRFQPRGTHLGFKTVLVKFTADGVHIMACGLFGLSSQGGAGFL